MPELPEVETIVRDLNKTLPGKTIANVMVHDAFVLRQKTSEFIRKLKQQTINQIVRRGKAIIIHLSSGDFLVVQLMMTGQLVVNSQKDKHARIEFILTDGSVLLYNDQRKFGQLRVVTDLSQIKHFSILGPEPLTPEFTIELIHKAFKKSKRPIKNLLLDHTVVAGIGNIYACEILFRSRLSPERQAHRITSKEAALIHRHIREVLQEAIRHRGSSMRNYRDALGKKGKFNELLSVYARQGQPCVQCQQLIVRITQAGRSTFYCRHCQK